MSSVGVGAEDWAAKRDYHQGQIEALDAAYDPDNDAQFRAWSAHATLMNIYAYRAKTQVSEQHCLAVLDALASAPAAGEGEGAG